MELLQFLQHLMMCNYMMKKKDKKKTPHESNLTSHMVVYQIYILLLYAQLEMDAKKKTLQREYSLSETPNNLLQKYMMMLLAYCYCLKFLPE